MNSTSCNDSNEPTIFPTCLWDEDCVCDVPSVALLHNISLFYWNCWNRWKAFEVKRLSAQRILASLVTSLDRWNSIGAPYTGPLIGSGHARGFGRIAGETRDFAPCVAFARPHQIPALSRFPISKKAGQNRRFPTFSAPKPDLNSDPMTINLAGALKTTNKIMVMHA